MGSLDAPLAPGLSSVVAELEAAYTNAPPCRAMDSPDTLSGGQFLTTSAINVREDDVAVTPRPPEEPLLPDRVQPVQGMM